jgi:tRNA pseudouridine38-40 synthase
VAAHRLTIAYEGGPFAGWAAQPGLRTVEGEVEAALERILGERLELSVAGRTDAGVHAWGQVASFETQRELPERLPHRLNAVLPSEIAVIDAIAAPRGFDARRDARSRTYCYRVLASPMRHPFEVGRGLWWPRPTDPEALARCARLVTGSHDFTAFTPTQTDHVRFDRRVLHAEWRSHKLSVPFPGDLLEFWIEADAFMRHMVRILVGTMLEIPGGGRTVEEFEALLAGGPRKRAGPTAPPHGLYLASVRYAGGPSPSLRARVRRGSRGGRAAR